MFRSIFCAALLLSLAPAHAESLASYRAGPIDYHLSDSNPIDGRVAAYAFTSTTVNEVALPVPTGPAGSWGDYVHSGSLALADRQATWYADPYRMEALSRMDSVPFGSFVAGTHVEYGVWLAPHSRLDITAPVWMEWDSEETSQTWIDFWIQFTPHAGMGYPLQNAGTGSYSGGGRSGEKYRLVNLSLQSGADQLY